MYSCEFIDEKINKNEKINKKIKMKTNNNSTKTKIVT